MQLQVHFSLAAKIDRDLEGVLARLFNALAACSHNNPRKAQLTDALPDCAQSLDAEPFPHCPDLAALTSTRSTFVLN